VQRAAIGAVASAAASPLGRTLPRVSVRTLLPLARRIEELLRISSEEEIVDDRLARSRDAFAEATDVSAREPGAGRAPVAGLAGREPTTAGAAGGPAAPADAGAAERPGDRGDGSC
jgi:hypothetical protein